MVIKAIRDFNRAAPFKPYEIWMTTGKRYKVLNPDLICIAPRGSFVIVYGRNDRPHQLNTSEIESASLLQSRRRKRAKVCAKFPDRFVLRVEIPSHIIANLLRKYAI